MLQNSAVDESAPGAATDSVLVLQKHIARLVREQLLTSAAATALLRSVERALAQSREDRCLAVRIVDGLLDALDRGQLPAELCAFDETAGTVSFHVAPVLELLVETGHLARASLPRLKQVLLQAEQWFPESGLSGYQRRATFGTGDRRRALTLKLSRGREFTKREEAVPLR